MRGGLTNAGKMLLFRRMIEGDWRHNQKIPMFVDGYKNPLWFTVKQARLTQEPFGMMVDLEYRHDNGDVISAELEFS